MSPLQGFGLSVASVCYRFAAPTGLPIAFRNLGKIVVQGLKGEGWVLDIYNRRGQTIFQTPNYHNEWGLDAAPVLYCIMLRRPASGYQYKGWLKVLR